VFIGPGCFSVDLTPVQFHSPMKHLPSSCATVTIVMDWLARNVTFLASQPGSRYNTVGRVELYFSCGQQLHGITFPKSPN
jgi:hypothetical protein